MAIKSAVGKMERYSQLRCGVAGNKQATLLPFFAARHCGSGQTDLWGGAGKWLPIPIVVVTHPGDNYSVAG
ncbi:hypothetical protein IVB33_22275 [Bradyrhizobium sp. 24]|uniref:hypothetical protein n=1 Tax=unclassified Bradyrhizobium TaxID=2631580 RepID=UPI001FF8095C|nr:MULTISPECIES: hypothetical protein [unclassified Bradyrhizobium]MCK1300475.1 hypothetical protein [Bradyrhizobium sp. 37]MCK1380044.1 hypothetical protein [Bradyrhizobium sp. 24]MCK1772310.1 hypothetical protein [Bradyrhizobium sp. 134]